MADRRISSAGKALIHRFEGHTPYAYNDPIGFCTAGPGVLLHRSNCTSADFAKYGTRSNPKISPADYEAMFRRTVAPREQAVNDLVKVPLNQHEFDALVSFVYNVGAGNFASSTLLRLLNLGKRQAAAAEFDRWVRGGGVVLPGLVNRRNAEQALFLKPTGGTLPRRRTRRQRLLHSYHVRRRRYLNKEITLKTYLFAKARLGLWDKRYCALNGVSCNLTPTLKKVATKGFAMGLVPTSTNGGQHAPGSYHKQVDAQGRIKGLDMGNRPGVIGTQKGLRRMQRHQRWLHAHWRELGLAEVIGPINELTVLRSRETDLSEGSPLEQMHDTHTHTGDPT